jgi:hypothetical protein
MKPIICYLRDWLASVDKRVLLLSALFAAMAIYINYHLGLNQGLKARQTFFRVASWFAIFLAAFSFPYLLSSVFQRRPFLYHKHFLILLLLAPLLFACKMSLPLLVQWSTDSAANAYWNAVVYFPLKLIILLFCLWIIWKLFDKEQPFWGTRATGFKAGPYWIMLLIMLPLVAAASTQNDFLATYPKMSHLAYLQTEGKGIYKLLYELSYGTDFLSIEVFFRGFLILAFAKWAGRDAILPMAVFYCTIHFGKPLGECISSFFGGILLGVVTYRTRTIWGGLMVHLGIAWLMELGGWLGHLYIN